MSVTSSPIQYINVLESHLLMVVALWSRANRDQTEPRNRNGRDRMFIYVRLWPLPSHRPATHFHSGEPATRTSRGESRLL
jgi:hypothetical protein